MKLYEIFHIIEGHFVSGSGDGKMKVEDLRPRICLRGQRPHLSTDVYSGSEKILREIIPLDLLKCPFSVSFGPDIGVALKIKIDISSRIKNSAKLEQKFLKEIKKLISKV